MTAEVSGAEPFPEEIRGEKVCGLLWCYTGPADQFEKYIQQARDVAKPLFEFTTEDVTFDGGSLGKAESKEEWREMTEVIFREELLLTRHIVSNGIVEVDGDKASGKWYLHCPTINGNDEAIWLQGTYNIDFRKMDGEWKVSSFNFDPTYVTPYNKGWAEQPFLEGMSGELEW